MTSQKKKVTGKMKVDDESINPDEKLKREIAGRIRQARKLKDFSVRHLAESIGVSREVLNQIELGNNHVNAILLYKLATRLQCEVALFFPQVNGEYALSPKKRALVALADPESLPWIEDMFNKKKK